LTGCIGSTLPKNGDAMAMMMRRTELVAVLKGKLIGGDAADVRVRV